MTPAGQITVAPGQEVSPCYFKTLPTTSEFDVGTIQSWMTAGSSRLLIVYQVNPSAKQPDGLTSCGMGGDDAWMFAASLSGQIVELKMPDGVGEPLPAGAQVMLAMHFTNTTTAVMKPQVKVNLIAAHDYQTKAASLVAFNTAIDIPAATASGPGAQTVTGSCAPPVGASFFAAGTHTNHPDVAVWTAPSFLSIQSGDSLAYSCAYSNPGTTPVTVGETDQSNEVCMVVSYYFPAGTASCQ